MSVLNVNNLSVEFIGKKDSNRVLNNVSINVEKNKIIGIVGESGSGKSTLIKSIMRILSAPGLITSGTVHFNDQNILAIDENALYNIRWKEISLI